MGPKNDREIFGTKVPKSQYSYFQKVCITLRVEFLRVEFLLKTDSGFLREYFSDGLRMAAVCHE